MKQNRYLAVAIIAMAIFAGCTTTSAKKNSLLAEAHANYNDARANPDVTTLAPVELKDAGDSLSRADAAASKGESTNTVNHLAYVANQQVGIAQETAKTKTAELAVTNATAKRNQVRLDARTAEADAAKQKVATMQMSADQNAAELANSNAATSAANQRVALMQESANQQAEALGVANANAAHDQALIEEQERQLRELNAKKSERGLVITLGDVFFSTDKAQLKGGGIRSVQKLADFLTKYPQRKVLVEGFTDSTGSESHNQALSERRSDAVRVALMDRGIGGERASIRGYGESYPVASNATAAGRQLNRRVEIILSDDQGNISSR